MAERSLRKQLVTAKSLVALFENQLGEYDRMNRAQRRSVRGRDIEARLPGLRDGHAKWTARVAELEAQIAAETPPAVESEVTEGEWVISGKTAVGFDSAKTSFIGPNDPVCPECTAGKHTQCAEFSVDAGDNITDCPCACRDTPGGTQ